MSSSEPRRTSAFLAAFSPGSKKSRGGQDAAVPLSPSQPVPVFQFQVDGDDDNGRKDDAVVEKAAEMKQVPPPMLMIDTAESVDDLMNMPRVVVRGRRTYCLSHVNQCMCIIVFHKYMILILKPCQRAHHYTNSLKYSRTATKEIPRYMPLGTCKTATNNRHKFFHNLA